MDPKNEDVYVVGFLLVLIIASSVPITSGAALIMSGLLFLMLLVRLHQKGILI